jgi:hypothetical protein
MGTHIVVQERTRGKPCFAFRASTRAAIETVGRGLLRWAPYQAFDLLEGAGNRGDF